MIWLPFRPARSRRTTTAPSSPSRDESLSLTLHVQWRRARYHAGLRFVVAARTSIAAITASLDQTATALRHALKDGHSIWPVIKG